MKSFNGQQFIQSLLLGFLFIVFTLVLFAVTAWEPYVFLAILVLFISIIRSYDK